MYLIDGNCMAHRAYHSNSDPVESIKKIIGAYPYRVFFDGKRSWRYDKLPEYKGHRSATPDGVLAMIVKMKIDLEYEQHDDLEADDLIAHYCRRRFGKFLSPTWIVSRDKDLMQLVDDDRGIRMYDPVSKEQYTELSVHQKLGVFPRDVALMLSICGDESDGINGVPGFGRKNSGAVASCMDISTLKVASKNTLQTIAGKTKGSILFDKKDLVVSNYGLINLRSTDYGKKQQEAS